MCLTLSPLVNLHRWNWDGDRIVHECIVPSSRPVVGRTGSRSQYDIDVREFLVTERNEIMRRTLAQDVPSFAREHGRTNSGAIPCTRTHSSPLHGRSDRRGGPRSR